MFESFIAWILVALTTISPAPQDEPRNPFDDALHIATIDTSEVASFDVLGDEILIRTKADWFLVDRSNVSFDDDRLILSMSGDATDTVLNTDITDQSGRVHRVVTDCRRFSSLDSCARKHAEAVRIMEGIFPPR